MDERKRANEKNKKHTQRQTCIAFALTHKNTKSEDIIYKKGCANAQIKY